MLRLKSTVAAALLLLVLTAGISNALQTSVFVRSVSNWTPYVITAIAGMDAFTDGSVSDICEACNGTGIVGDGSIELECLVCDGTGKKKKRQ